MHQETIVRDWMDAVLAEEAIPTARTLSEVELRDHLDRVLGKLIHQLGGGEAQPHPPEGAVHGAVRYVQQYRVEELVREVSVLRSSFLDFFSAYLKECRQIGTEDYRRVTQLVHRYFDEICSESVASYVKERDEQAQAHAHTLRAVNETLEKINREYEAADSYRRRTLRTVAHEMATPVNALGLGVNYLSESDDPDERVEAKSLVDRTLEHLRTMLDQLAEFARTEGDLERLRVTEFTTLPLFQYLVATFEPIAAAKRLDFRASLDSELQWLRSDESKVQRIAVNLLSNAMKYCEAGDVVLRMQAVDGERWLLEVEDTGCGIPKADLERIFGEFERLSHHAEQPGLGLGLSIVKLLSERLGGEIEVESTVGKGSRFRVTLPRAI